ncbi:hypothetical protein AB0L53_12195 [Nonomuraea sp. NPDC052129]|uniref:hypothetical protein n=1 Tax=Nonomuraea sp. NPDC052129 TaxID=3154651 RepID=UPI00343FE2FB
MLLEEFCPQMAGRIVEINDKVRLHQASDANLAARAETLASKVRARAVRDDTSVACVFVHEDLDNTDSDAYPIIRERVQKALESALGNVHYALAVSEIEAWLLLFPDALSAIAASWSLPAKHKGKDTGRLPDPKKILMNEVSGAGRRYRESDAPEILDRAAKLGVLDRPVGRNRSFDQIRVDVARCCTEHIRK